jgi:small redox-active disulfide protein 2
MYRGLATAAEQAAESLGLEYQIEEVTDLEYMIGLGVTAMPALAVDGKVKVEGRVPSVAEIEQILDGTEPCGLGKAELAQKKAKVTKPEGLPLIHQ